MSVARLCSRVIATVSPSENIKAAAARMADNDVGTLVVLGKDDSSQAVGIITDRDIVIRCVARGWDPEETAISELMTSPVHTIDEHTPLENAAERMARGGNPTPRRDRRRPPCYRLIESG